MKRPRLGFAVALLLLLCLTALQAACGEQVTNVFSNVTAPPDARQSP